jgi:hypothetical protein
MQTKIANLAAVAFAVAALFGIQNVSANVGTLPVSSHAGGVMLEREKSPGAARDGDGHVAGGLMLEKAPTTVKD